MSALIQILLCEPEDMLSSLCDVEEMNETLVSSGKRLPLSLNNDDRTGDPSSSPFAVSKHELVGK